jgi:hypothetical protein
MRRYHHDDETFDRRGLLRDGARLHVPMFAMDSMHCGASPRLLRVHDGTGDSGLAMHRPGFRITDAPPSDELQRAYDSYEHALATAWRHNARNAGALSDPPKTSDNDAASVCDIETAYRLYNEEISQAWKKPR